MTMTDLGAQKANGAGEPPFRGVSVMGLPVSGAEMTAPEPTCMP